MTQEHPITPPPEIIRQWQMQIEYCSKRADREAVVAKIFQLGADMELEACCEWLRCSLPGYDKHYADYLHTARRPKPPSLKEQALADLDLLKADATTHGLGFDASAIRRALESLPG